MQADKVLVSILTREGLKVGEVCRRMGRSPRYLDSYKYHGRVPRIDTFAEMLQACGYELVARNLSDGYEVPIDPPTE